MAHIKLLVEHHNGARLEPSEPSKGFLTVSYRGATFYVGSYSPTTPILGGHSITPEIRFTFTTFYTHPSHSHIDLSVEVLTYMHALFFFVVKTTTEDQRPPQRNVQHNCTPLIVF